MSRRGLLAIIGHLHAGTPRSSRPNRGITIIRPETHANEQGYVESGFTTPLPSGCRLPDTTPADSVRRIVITGVRNSAAGVLAAKPDAGDWDADDVPF